MQETPVRFLGQEDLLEKGRDRLPTPVFLDFHCDSAGKESAHNAGDLSSIPRLGRSLGEVLAWRIPWTIHGVTKSRTQLSDLKNKKLVDQYLSTLGFNSVVS